MIETVSGNKKFNKELGVEITKEAFNYAETKKMRSGAVSFNGKTIYGFFTKDNFYYCQDGFCYRRK